METERLVARHGEQAIRDLRAVAYLSSPVNSSLTIVRRTTDIPRKIAVQRGAIVTCVSAAGALGIPTTSNPTEVHLAVPRGHSRMRGGPTTSGIVVHRETGPIGRDMARPWLADVATTINRLITCPSCSVVQAVAALDHVLNRGLMTLDDLRIPDSGPGSRRALTAVERSNSRARSLLETQARLQLEDAGIGPIEVGVEIETVGEVDLVVDGLVVVECDGKQHINDPEEVAKDRTRDHRLIRLGYIVLRFSSQQIWSGGQVATTVREALERHHDLPRPPRVPFLGNRVYSWSERERLDMEDHYRDWTPF